MLAEVTVTLEPEAVRLPERLAEVPTPTLPKLRALGETPKTPGDAPVPEIGIRKAVVFETAEMIPEVALAACGAKLAVKVKLSPRFNSSGRSSPERLKPDPEIAIFQTFTL
jgi:hypothetical protein